VEQETQEEDIADVEVAEFDEDAELQARIWNQFMREPDQTDSNARLTVSSLVTSVKILGGSVRNQD